MMTFTDWSWWCRVYQLSWDSSVQAEEEVPTLWEEEERCRDKTITMDTAGPSHGEGHQVTQGGGEEEKGPMDC